MVVTLSFLISPFWHLSKPFIKKRRVDFPQPDLPKMTTIPLFGKDRFMFCNTVLS